MEIVRLTPDNLEEAAKKASEVLAAGGIVVYPTDTVYGLAVDALDMEALNRLKRLKGRDTKRPISIVVPDLKTMEECGTLNEAARAFASTHLPGPLTLVLPAHPYVPSELTLNGGVGVRIPNDPFCLTLARAYGRPFTTTSANQTHMTTPKTVTELVWHFGPRVSEIALIIDDGERAGGSGSTVVSCLEETPRILRQGVLSREELGL